MKKLLPTLKAKTAKVHSKVVGGLILGASAIPAFAATDSNSTATNLANAVPTSFTGKWFWAAAALVIGAVVAIKGVYVIIRLLRRV